MRILFTSIGRRVELIEAFRNAADRIGIRLQIFGADITAHAPALLFCDKAIQICRISDPGYIPALLDICQSEHIDALIPTIDTDLMLLAEHKARFEETGTRVFISSREMVALCRDKRLTARFFEECGLYSPKTFDDYTRYDQEYPCFIKPKDGSSSINAFRADNEAELKNHAEQIEEYIVQNFIEGTEYTIDIFCDYEGNELMITPRIRRAVRSGEVLRTEVCLDAQIVSECRKLIERFKPCGAITVQMIRQKGTEKDYYIEINPRFGGGAPLSMKAGADSAEAMLRLLNGSEMNKSRMKACHGAHYSRFDHSVCVSFLTRQIEAIVFDLDDTLYSEREYVYSGFCAAAGIIPQVENAQEKMIQAMKIGKPAIDTVLHEAEIYSYELKQQCVQAYRIHEPEIHMYPGMRELIERLRLKGIKIGILTDGRPEGQRLKLKALALEELTDTILITDELGGESFRKPNDISFRVMQRRLNVPFEHMVYVGDNWKKDFAAPIRLGMQVVYFNNQDGLYHDQIAAEEFAGCVCSSIEELIELLDERCQ